MFRKLLQYKIPVIFDGDLYENILGTPCKLIKVVDKDTLTFRALSKEEFKNISIRFEEELTGNDILVFQHIISYNISSHKDRFIESKL